MFVLIPITALRAFVAQASDISRMFLAELVTVLVLFSCSHSDHKEVEKKKKDLPKLGACVLTSALYSVS